MKILTCDVRTLVFFFLVCCAPVAVGQVKNAFEPITQSERSVFVPAPRELLRPLTRASRAIEEGDTRQAVALLGQVLSNPSEQDFLVQAEEDAGAEGVSVSLCVRASQMLGRLSIKDREPYRLRYGTQAKLMINQAIESNDYQILSRLMRRYFFTEAGGLATMLLGHHYLDQGRPIAAANCFQRIVDVEETRRVYDPEASVLLATCRALSSSPQRAQRTLLNLKARLPSRRIEFNGNQIELFVDEGDAIPWLQKLIGNSPLRNITRVDEWVMLGGNPERNARSGSGFPLIHPRWKVPTENDPDIEKQITERQRELIFLDAAPIPSVQPLAIGDTILMRAFDRMFGVDFETGKRAWIYPPWQLTPVETPVFFDPTETLQLPNEQLTERFWQDSIYGQSSSDGKLVFMVPRPGFASKDSNRIDVDSLQLVDPIVNREFNELKAVEVDRQGAFKWQIGGATGLDEPALARAFFLGAPLPLDGSLYAVCQHDGFIKLVVLDGETGKLQWWQPLVSVEASTDVIDDRYRRLAGATPSYSDGVLVCATGAGALVAVELATRSLLWGFQFATPARKDVSRISPSQRFSRTVLGGLWRESTITIADGNVLHTPVDTQNLICVDLQTGYPKWKTDGKYVSQIPRGDSLYIACVESGTAVLVGRSSVRAIRLRDGYPAWEKNTVSFGRPSGRGYANQGSYYLPMSTATLLQIDLKNGKITKSVKTDGVLGNLICHRGDVISHGVDHLACYPQDQPKRRLVAQAESQGELSPELLAIKSQLQFHDGDVRSSVTSLAWAFERTRNPAYANRLTDLIIELIQTDYPFGVEIASRYETELKLAGKFRFAAASIEGMIRQNNLSDAFEQLLSLFKNPDLDAFHQDHFIDFATTNFDLSELAEGPGNGPGQPFRQATINLRSDRWVASRLQVIFDRAPEATRIELINKLRTFFYELELNDPASLYEIYQLFPSTMLPSEISLELATQLVEEGEFLPAYSLLGFLQHSDDTTDAANAMAQLCTMYMRCNSPIQAGQILAEMKGLDERIRIAGTESPVEFAARFRKQNRLDSGPLQPALSPTYTNATTDYSETERQLEFQMIPNEIRLSEFDDPSLEQYQFQFFSQSGELAITDRFGKSVGRFLARKNVQTEIPPINNYVFGDLKFHDNFGLLTIGSELFAIDWLKFMQGQDPVIWNLAILNGEKDQSSTLPAKNWGETRMSTRRLNYEKKIFAGAPSTLGICYLDGTNLFCVDPRDGSRLWQRTNFLPRSMLYGDLDKVIVWNPNQRDATVIDVLTGRQLKHFTLGPELGALWTNRGTQFVLTGIAKANASDLDTARPVRTTSPTVDPPDQSTENGQAGTPAEGQLVKTVGLYDLMSEKFIWNRRFAEKSVGCLIRNQTLVVVPQKGGIEFVSLSSGQTQFTTPLALESVEKASIDGIGATTAAGAFVLHLKRGTAATRVDLPSRRIRIRNLHYYDTFWTGYLLAVDSESGKPKWDQPVRIANFQVGKRMPYSMPFHVLVRRYERKEGQQPMSLQFVILDLSSGRSVANISIPYEFRNHYWTTWEPEQAQLRFQFATSQLTVGFHKASDFPPRPVASLTNASSIPLLKPALNTNLVDPEQESNELEAIRRMALAAEKTLEQEQAEESRLLQLEK